MIRKLSFGVILLVFTSGIASATDVEGGFLYDARYRTYTLHIPPCYNAEDSVPLVINLHGGGGNAAQQATLSQMNLKADADTFLVVYPNGTPLPIGYTGWNAGERYGSNVDDVGFISALIDTLTANYVIDTLGIYATGFSNGGCMCHRLACELSERIAAVAAVAGWLVLDDWNDCQPERLMPIMQFHSRNDPNGSYIYIDSVMEHWAERNGCDIGPDTFYNENEALRQRWTRTDDSCEVVFWTIEEYHAWPKVQVSANDEMWEFFLAHPMPEEEEPDIQEPTLPPSYELDPVSPGVFTQSATISFSLGSREHVTIKVFDVLGREIATVVDGVLDAGEHSVVLDATNMQNGVYFYRLETSTFSKTQSIRLLK
jgi:polyhydroxybutyrate depolymerase